MVWGRCPLQGFLDSTQTSEEELSKLRKIATSKYESYVAYYYLCLRQTLDSAEFRKDFILMKYFLTVNWQKNAHLAQTTPQFLTNTLDLPRSNFRLQQLTRIAKREIDDVQQDDYGSLSLKHEELSKRSRIGCLE